MAGGKKSRRNKKSKSKVKESSHAEQETSDLSNEITALEAIFGDDFQHISDMEFCMKLRPHSVSELSNENLSAELHIKCLHGYPYKPPKLHIKGKEGFGEEEQSRLLSMLVEQANSIAREGRVMIYDLVEAAIEFLSELCISEPPQEQDLQTLVQVSSGISDPDDLKLTDEDLQNVEILDVCRYVDLFGEPWGTEDQQWGGRLLNPLSRKLQTNNSFILQKGFNHMSDIGEKNENTNLGYKSKPEKKLSGSKSIKRSDVGNAKTLMDAENSAPWPVETDKLECLSEVSEEEIEELISEESQSKSISELLQEADIDIFWKASQNSIHGKLSSVWQEESFGEQNSSLSSQVGLTESVIKKEFVMAQLVRLVCGPRGPLPYMLPSLASQLQTLGIFPEWMKELIVSRPHVFEKVFRRLFSQCSSDSEALPEAPVSVQSFWASDPKLLGGTEALGGNSRYLTDFEELSLIGKGGFGHVVLCTNRLDGRRYAMKKIKLKGGSPQLNKKILREVATLSRLQHHHVVRYYQAWYETRVGPSMSILGYSTEGVEDSCDWIVSQNVHDKEPDFQSLIPSTAGFDETREMLVNSTYLYIQMEYCPRTLRQMLDSYTEPVDKDITWRIFRQIVEGLAHIHAQGIIHRDLTPSNVFFDAHNDIKIGDFGLAKFSSLEQTDRDPIDTLEMNGDSLDGTGQVGTYFYTAPEIDLGWPHIDDKVDMYSLGIVLFEIWHPFSTAMERHVILSELKNKGVVPSKWALEFPQQAALVKRLTASNPSDRPSALHVLWNDLPPRMEDEALNDVLRTIKSADDSSVFDQIIAAIFDGDRLHSKSLSLDKKEEIVPLVKEATFEDYICEVSKEVFTQHGARRFDTCFMDLIDNKQLPQSTGAIRFVSSTGSMLEIRSEMRIPFAIWVARKQSTSLKRYEIARVFRRGVGYSPPNEFLQGDFDIVGGGPLLPEAEAIKVAADIIRKCLSVDECEIRINHKNLLHAVWSWTGVKQSERQETAKWLALMLGYSPQSSDRKSQWVLIRRQLVQGLQLSEAVVDRLQIVERRLCGLATEALARLRGALPPSPLTTGAIEELSILLSYLRVWDLEDNVVLDALMTPSENCFSGIFFEVHLPKGCCPATSSKGMMLAVGGRYDQLIKQFWVKSLISSAPGAVGLSIALEKLISAVAAESTGLELTSGVLVCSRGGGGFLLERMTLVSELWDANIKADFVCSLTPSLTEQYEYANEHGFKWLVIVTDALDQMGVLKVKHLERRVEEDIPRTDLIKFFTEFPMNSIRGRKSGIAFREGK